MLLVSSISWLTACDDSNNGDDDSSIQFVDTGIQDSLSKTIDTYLEANQDDNSPGFSIIIRKDGVVVYSGNRGVANKLTATTITNDTGFRLGSVSKSFTAIAVMQLFEQGLLNLDDKLLSYIPELSTSWQDITIHHLLSHQSGIPDFLNDPMDNLQKIGLTNQGLISFLADNSELEFTPGSEGDYSNTGHVLLAEIVSRISGISFSEYMNAFIFEPLGMNNSYINNENLTIRDGDAINFADRDTYFGIQLFTYGTMAQVSSANDLSLFAQAMMNDELITEETYTLMRQPHTTFKSGATYGYGTNSGSVFSHNGNWDGFRTTIQFNTLTTFELILLSNGGDVSSVHYTQIRKLISHFHGD